MKKIFFSLLSILLFANAIAQTPSTTGDIKGFVYDKSTGEAIIFNNVYLLGTTYGSQTDINGFFGIKKVPVGKYNLVSTYIGYDTVSISIEVKAGEIISQKIYLTKRATQLRGAVISARRQEKLNQVQIGETKVSAAQIKMLPSIGGEPDIAQYMQVVPGVISSGDQGGQLYIRGGSPVQNKIMIDGMCIYNPFHSIGLFSVFETDAIKNADIKTAGFNSNYGGATSAIVDISTRDGNRKRLSGKLATNTFMSKILLEGPLKKMKENGGNESSSSFILTAKKSYLDKTSKILYPYIDTTGTGLPYSFNDIYGKLNFNNANGSKLNLFAFHFDDKANYEQRSLYKWSANGGGLNFIVSPANSIALISGILSASDYKLSLTEADTKPRTTQITNVNFQINFQYNFQENTLFDYGLDFNLFNTKYHFFNQLGINVGDGSDQNTTEFAFYAKYKKAINNKLVIEPGIRIPYYATLGENNYIEPRIGVKYNALSILRFKAAAGRYSQNLISTKSDRDIVNLFTGFLSGPEEKLYNTDKKISKSRIQKSWHTVLGVEYDLTKNVEINVEAYWKQFTQLININRSKIYYSDPNYVIETGNARGIDFLAKYQQKQLYIWFVYSLGFVNRFDGKLDKEGNKVAYLPPFDRRHNINSLITYTFGKNHTWDASLRWNFGSGFPFTLTQGFFEKLDFSTAGLNTNYLTQNGTMGVIYDSTINGGRLPYYHRLDLSIKKKYYFGQNGVLEIAFSIINAYNRANIFYFDRIRYTRINQLPFLPALGINYNF